MAESLIGDKAEQIPRSNNEHSLHNDYCHIGHSFTTGWLWVQQSMAVMNETEKVY